MLNKSETKSLPVLHVIDSLGIGGAETLLLSVVRNLHDVQNHVISLSDHHPLASQLPKDCRFQALGFKSKLDVFRCVRAIRRYIKEHNIEVVHSHLVLSNLIARMATSRKTRLINSLHNLNGEKLFSRKRSWPYLAERLTLKKRHFILAVSREVLTDYQEHIAIPGPSAVMHNFVEDRFFSAAPHYFKPGYQLKVLAIGSLKPQKNFGFLLDAFRKLPTSISLDIYGDGPLRKELEAKLTANLTNSIRLMGRHATIEQVMPHYDLLIMPSLYEGHPVALVEAMAAGMPALMSDIPVLREATQGYGLYFRLNDVEDLQKKLTDIQSGRLDINHYAKHNWELANSSARKESYISRLMELYRCNWLQQPFEKQN